MILNGIEITPESLKAQLEGQGWEISPKQGLKKNDIIWVRMCFDGETSNGAYRFYKDIGENPTSFLSPEAVDDCYVPDALIRQYEKLVAWHHFHPHEMGPFDERLVKPENRLSGILAKIKAIKTRTAGK